MKTIFQQASNGFFGGLGGRTPAKEERRRRQLKHQQQVAGRMAMLQSEQLRGGQHPRGGR